MTSPAVVPSNRMLSTISGQFPITAVYTSGTTIIPNSRTRAPPNRDHDARCPATTLPAVAPMPKAESVSGIAQAGAFVVAIMAAER